MLLLLLFALLGTVSASVGFSPINGGCATLETPAQCNQASSCAWRWNSNSCETSCRSEYAFDMSGCCNDDACEWYSAPHAWECRERCGSLATSDQCVVEPSCAWDTKNQVCSSSCSRYGNSSYNCSTDPSCMWSGSMCLTNPNPPQTLMMIGFTASSYDMARMVNMTVGWRATLTLAVQADLMAAYHSRVVMNPTWTADWGALVGSYWAPTTQVPSAVSTNNQTVAAITWTQTLKVCNAALLPGTMGPVNVAFVQPVNPPDVGTGLSAGQIALVVLGTVLFVGVIGAMVAVWMYRRNPYAAAVGPPVTAVASFPEEEYDRLKTMNERTLSYEELRSIHQRWEAIHGAAGANESFNRWPIIAQCDMPKKYHRSPEIRTAWFELCTKLFPTAFEQFTHIRIGFDEAGFVRCAPAKAQQVLQYNTALRVVLQPNRNSVDLVLLGTARFLVVDPSRDDVGVPPMDNAFLLEPDAPDTCNAVKDLFDQSMLCSHTGTIGNRKIVMGRLVRRTSFVVPASDDLMANDAMVLIGAPASWDADMVEAAIMLMIRIGCQRLVVGALPCWSNMHVHARRGGGETGGWHIHVHPPQALSVLIAVSCRFWGLDDDILCCQCTSGIPITSTSNVALSASSTTTAREEFEMHLIAAPRE